MSTFNNSHETFVGIDPAWRATVIVGSSYTKLEITHHGQHVMLPMDIVGIEDGQVVVIDPIGRMWVNEEWLDTDMRLHNRIVNIKDDLGRDILFRRNLKINLI